MRTTVALVGIALVLFASRGESLAQKVANSSADFFVAVDGRDSWSGQLPKANGAKSDGPFATLAKARDAVREQKNKSTKKDFVVKIRGGTYRLNETLVFSLADSARENGTITYAAYEKEKPVISSGVAIKNWRKLIEFPSHLPAVAHGKIWVAEAPLELERILTLYNADQRLPRARGSGFSSPDSVDVRTAPRDEIKFPPDAIRNWPDLLSGELLVIPSADYEFSILPFASVDENAGVAKLKEPASRPIGKVKFFSTNAWVENVLAVLDEPGEWVFNRQERKIYYWPGNGKPGENIVAPKLTELIRVEGKIDYDGPRDEPVRGIIFRGLNFTHAERYQWHGYTGWSMQHHWEMFDRPTSALRFRGAENCAVEACRFTASSGAGIRLDLYAQKNRILNNEFSHLGGLGILLAGYGPGTKNVNRQNVVSNNWLHHTSEIYWASPALMVWQSGDNHIANNLIHNVPYTGLSVSTRALPGRTNNVTSDGSRTVRWNEIPEKTNFSWNYLEQFLHSRNNLVERNEIHHVMERLGDGNSIYISGAGGGNRIYENYVHDTLNDHCSGPIRCDDFQEETIIERNIIFRHCAIGQGITSKGKNYILNNIVAELHASKLPIRPERVTRGYIGLVVNPVIGSRIHRNIIYARDEDFPVYTQNRIYGQGGEPRLRDCVADYNLYFNTADPNWGRKHFQVEQRFGVDLHSISSDPLFVNVDKGDFRLRPNSPALKLGFEPIDVSKIGLQRNHPFHR